MIATLLARFAPYKLAAEIMVFGLIAAGVLYGAHQFLEHERDIGRQEVQRRWDRQIALDKAAAATQTADWQARLTAATTEGAKREETIRSLAANAAAATGGLRDAVAKINGAVPSYSTDALRAVTSTYGDLLAECAARRQNVAEEAERLNSEKRAMIEAWPLPNP
jgi:Tfp pilus assembly protein PilX